LSSKTLWDQLFERYHRIPFEQIDPTNLNFKFVDELVDNRKLRSLMEKRDHWESSDFETVTKHLAAKKWLYWEIELVFTTYSSILWNQQDQKSKKRIKELAEPMPDTFEDPFDTHLDLFPFLVNKDGIYKQIKNGSSEEDPEPYLITKTPIIVSHIGESLEENAEYNYKIMYM
jgi:hypothetical protein